MNRLEACRWPRERPGLRAGDAARENAHAGDTAGTCGRPARTTRPFEVDARAPAPAYEFLNFEFRQFPSAGPDSLLGRPSTQIFLNIMPEK